MYFWNLGSELVSKKNIYKMFEFLSRVSIWDALSWRGSGAQNVGASLQNCDSQPIQILDPASSDGRFFFGKAIAELVRGHVVPTSWLNYLRRQIVFCLYVFSLYFCLFCIFYSLSLYLWTYQNFLWLYLCHLFILCKILHFITFTSIFIFSKILVDWQLFKCTPSNFRN